MSDIPKPPWLEHDYDHDLAFARATRASYETRRDIVASMLGGPDRPYELPRNWSLLGNDEMRHPDNFREDLKAGFAAYTFEIASAYDKRLVIVIRGSDSLQDWDPGFNTQGPNLPLAVDADLVEKANPLPIPFNEDVRNIAGKIQTTLLPEWSPAFEDMLNYGLEIQRKYESQGYTIEVAGHSMGGAGAQLLSYTFGWGGRTFDAAGAANIIESEGYDNWLKEHGITPQGAPQYNPDAPQDPALLNYVVNGSPVSDLSGPHIGATAPITALGGREGIGDYVKYGASRVASAISEVPFAGKYIAKGLGIAEGVVSSTEIGAKVADIGPRHDMDRIVRVFQDAVENKDLRQHEIVDWNALKFWKPETERHELHVDQDGQDRPPPAQAPAPALHIPPFPESASTLQTEDQTRQLVNLQSELIQLGYQHRTTRPLTVNGVNDEATRQAVTAFQAQNDLPLSGQADQATRQALQEALLRQQQARQEEEAKRREDDPARSASDPLAAPAAQTAQTPGVQHHPGLRDLRQALCDRLERKGQLAGLSDDRLTELAGQAYQAGLRADIRFDATVDGDRFFASASDITHVGKHTSLDLSQPPVSPQETLQAVTRYDRQQAELAAQFTRGPDDPSRGRTM